MSEYVQLFMRRENLDTLPPLIPGEGVTLHTHIPGQEANWEDLIEKAFGRRYSFRNWLVPLGNCQPEFIHYVSCNGKDVATAMGTENPKFPGEGWLRMVGADPAAAGHGYGKLAVLAAMHGLKNRGYESILLSTDDFRLPALKVYLSLGFQPVMTHESHPDRWAKVLAILNSRPTE